MQVVLRNGNIGDAEADNVASTIHVVRAAYINLVVLPSRNWILQRSRHYVINAELYDSESHQIYPSANLVVQVVFAKAFFEILASSANGTTTDVRAVRTGRTEITAKLIGIKDRWGSQTTFPTPISKVFILQFPTLFCCEGLDILAFHLSFPHRFLSRLESNFAI